MEVRYKLGDGKELDLILHSPGGSPSAAEAIVSYLRSRFDDIRVIVPLKAMSAATMVACAANQIVLGKHSFPRPTDPQMLVETSLGRRMVPAQAILDQFKMAQKDCKVPSMYASWQPMLNQYGPSLLVQCKSELKLSKILVQKWLESYMFANKTNGKELAKDISSWLANHSKFKSLSQPIPRDRIKKRNYLWKTLKRIKNYKNWHSQFFTLLHIHLMEHLLAKLSKISPAEHGLKLLKLEHFAKSGMHWSLFREWLTGERSDWFCWLFANKSAYSI